MTDLARTQIYTLSLHDALPISEGRHTRTRVYGRGGRDGECREEFESGRSRRRAVSDRVRQLLLLSARAVVDRKSTRLNSSHLGISYAVFCLKKKRQS